MTHRSSPPAIAVIGLACRYPDATNPRHLWENILARRRQFRRIPDCRLPLADYYDADKKVPDKTYGRQAAVIDGFDFDWAARRIPLSTVRTTDIVHWLALETSLAAVADAGYAKETLPGQRTGVIVGNTLTGEQTRANTMRLRWPFVRRALHTAARVQGMEEQQIHQLTRALKDRYTAVSPPVDEDTLAGGLSNTIAGRICNHLNLMGGGFTVDGACASSLLAVAHAASRLVEQDLDLAIVGGVDISLDPFELIGFAKTGALTDGEMTVYDRDGKGFIPGEGCGFMVLKMLETARRDGLLTVDPDPADVVRPAQCEHGDAVPGGVLDRRSHRLAGDPLDVDADQCRCQLRHGSQVDQAGHFQDPRLDQCLHLIGHASTPVSRPASAKAATSVVTRRDRKSETSFSADTMRDA